ncbi:hypothetical protein HYH03_007589 [Edaphochlamys debaryana]|uniref:DNA helicase n=1 Tax=Edaphochlamys debaryana TaxID=47281 RepID=A0A835Y2W6_9CHLO|nr:hypothetical protein HYH03_007589 [Edaphochlamys debaryana]|eukprot:KAG2494234.1 hypothetical protein HYH03_007589 [Edaphochlamys debaryana]
MAEAEAAKQPPPPPPPLRDSLHVRLVGLPPGLDPRPTLLRPPLARVGCAQLHQLLCLSGTIVRSGPVRMWEAVQVYECTRCGAGFPLRGSLESGGEVAVPEECTNTLRGGQQCPGTKFRKVAASTVYSAFQEVRLQASSACVGVGEPPASLTVVLQDELADSVRPGDSVDVTGVLVPRWLSASPGQRCSLELVLLANNATPTSRPAGPQGGAAQHHDAPGPGPLAGLLPGPGLGDEASQLACLFEDFWAAHASRPMLGRNKILAGVCPNIAGLLPAKLAVMLILAGGVGRRDPDGGTALRGELHLLMVGDPGVGKSQLMKWACQACPGRAVLTTGRGSSAAGLTACAVREGDSWSLEAGALVLADGGLCCIDEFDGIRPQERAVVHEAMEQQTVHVAKAGLVTSLPTRTAVLAALNPRPGAALSSSRPLTEVTGLEGPLLSRFDLVLLLADPRNPEWDRVVAGHVLSRKGAGEEAAAAAGEAPSAGSGAGPTPLLPSPGSLLALPSPSDLGAPLPQEPRLGPAPSGALAAAGAGPGCGGAGEEDDESQLTIAQKVAWRLAGASGAGCSSGGAGKGRGAGRGTQGQGSQATWARPTLPTPHSQGPQPEWGQGGSSGHSSCGGASSGGAVGSSSGGSSEGGAGSSGGRDGAGPGGSAWTAEVIRAYLGWVKSRPPPVMTPEAERVLVAYYGAMRAAGERTAARSTIRALESLIRTAQAHARLTGGPAVRLRDAVVAVVLADAAQQLLHVPGSDCVTCARFPADPDDELDTQTRIVLGGLGLTDLLPALLEGPQGPP